MSLISSIMPQSLKTIAAGGGDAPQGAAPVGAVPVAMPAGAAVPFAPGGTDATAQATLGAEATLPEPPQPTKTLLSSVLRGAVTGASLMFSANKFMPGALASIVGMIPFLPAVSFPMGAAMALGAGAAVGGVIGLIGGIRKVRKEAAEYAQKQQEAAGALAGQPMVGPDGQPLAIDPATGLPAGQSPIPAGMPGTMPVPGAEADAAAADEPADEPAADKPKKAKKNPVMDEDYRASDKRSDRADKAGRADRAAADAVDGCAHDEPRGRTRHHIKRGDTLWALSQRYGVTINEIVEVNPKITNPNLIYAGDTIVIPGKRGSKDAA